MVQFLVEECNFYIHQRNEEALAKAILKGNSNIEEYLIGKGACRDIAVDTIRAAASWNLQEAEAQWVLANTDSLETSATEDTFDGCYCNAFRAACRLNDLDYIKALITKGAKVKNDGTVAFIDACKYGNLRFVKFFIEQGIYVHMDSGLALHEARSHNHPQIVAILEGLGVRDLSANSDSLTIDWRIHDV